MYFNKNVLKGMSSAVHMRRFMEYGYEIRARSKATLRMLFAGKFTINEGIAWAQQLLASENECCFTFIKSLTLDITSSDALLTGIWLWN
ncbi:hypothetical protein T11_10170 [Trichinella zimbabwensis]|uniref:Uncharacterized protein n=1 Tax=Trichinella zimbabwensis TaxID=268475 RepID=A0A0V1HSS0_9BILA|nr:hypothetical protein T11_10170 [Trichinella zimbabwensis]